jgi:phage shock protein PspC (stress-responsive transcriptional regulator)
MPTKTPPKTETPETPPPPTGGRFFGWIRSLGLVRQPGWIGGVSAGIADRLGIDVLIVRGILVVIAVLGGPAVLLYAAAWLLLPDRYDRIHLEDLLRGKIEAPVVAIAVLVALSLLPVTQGFWWFGSLYWGQPHWGDSVGRAIWTIVILGALVWFVVWFSRRAQHGAVPPTTTGTDSTTARPMPATTDDRPTTIPSPDGPPPPPAPAANAGEEELAAWRASQEQWKTEHEAFRVQQAAERHAASQAAAAAARAERLARAAVYRAAYRRTRSNPLYSAALIGVALVAGAITALVLGGGAPGALQFLAGLAVAVGILGLGIIVNGAIGRRSGGASGMAVLLLIPLILAGFFPQSSHLQYTGDATFTPHGHAGSSATYVEGSGDVTVDLTSYFSTPRPTGPTSATDGRSSGFVHVLVGQGDVTLILPEDEYVTVDSHVWGGDHAGGDTEHRYSVAGDAAWKNVTRAIDVEVDDGNGTVSIIRTP